MISHLELISSRWSDKMKIGFFLLLFSVLRTEGDTITEIRTQTGSGWCKEKCLRQTLCRAIVYNATSYTCAVVLAGNRRTVETLGLFISRGDLTRAGSQVGGNICKLTECRQRWQSCVVSRAAKPVCTEEGCPACRHAPRIKNTDLVLTVRPSEAVAQYSCHSKYSFYPGELKTLTCKSCIWDSFDEHCRMILKSFRGTRLAFPVRIPSEKTIQISCQRTSRIGFQLRLMHNELMILDVRYSQRRRSISFTATVHRMIKKLTKDHFIFPKGKSFRFIISRRRRSFQVQIRSNAYSVTVPDYNNNRDIRSMTWSMLRLTEVVIQ